MRTRVLLLLILAMVLSGCGKRNPVSAPAGGEAHHNAAAREWHGPPRQLKRSELTEAEQKYGIAPVPDSTVTYQPDVIIVGGGAAAIRSEDPNGFRWTIDGDAPRAKELAPGRVFFMTGRAVGRVLDVRPEGDFLIVTVGPVDITEIILKANIHIKDMSIDFNEAIAHTSPGLPAQVASIAAPRPHDNATPAMFVTDAGWRLYQVLAPASAASPAPDVSKVLEKNFKIVPSVSKTGIGVSVSADGGGLKVSAESLVGISTPKLEVILLIDNGISEASIKLEGAASLTWKFDVSTDVGMRANVDAVFTPDTDFSIPVGGIGPVPFAVTVRQRFSIKTALGVRDSELHATGVYSFTGGFWVGYQHGKWGVGGPTGFTSKASMTQGGAGRSIAITGLDLANQIKVIAGVGTHGFVVGPYFSFTTAVGAFRNSDVGMIACNAAVLDIKLSGGVGYLIPKSVTNAINSILRTLNIQFQIKGEGGLEPSQAETILSKSSQMGGCKPPDKTGEKGVLSGPV